MNPGRDVTVKIIRKGYTIMIVNYSQNIKTDSHVRRGYL